MLVQPLCLLSHLKRAALIGARRQADHLPIRTGLAFSTVTGPEQHHTVRLQRQESREHRSAEAERNTKHCATPTLRATARVECSLSGAPSRSHCFPQSGTEREGGGEGGGGNPKDSLLDKPFTRWGKHKT